MKVKWSVEGAGCGPRGGRTYTTEVPDEELRDCSTRDEQLRLIEEAR